MCQATGQEYLRLWNCLKGTERHKSPQIALGSTYAGSQTVSPNYCAKQLFLS